MRLGFSIVASLAFRLGFSFFVLASAHAEEATEVAQAAPSPPDCRDTGSFALPQIPWMGDFTYRVSLTAKDGRPDDVSITTVRGPDTVSNRSIVDGLREHIRKNYVCASGDLKNVFYLSLHFKHDMPAALMESRRAAWAARRAEMASAAASASAAAASDSAAGTLVPVRAGMVCTTMGKPEVPRVHAVGKLSLEALVGVTDGKVTLVDIKLKLGSKDPAMNQKFIDLVSHTIRATYHCPGDHVFRQEFAFTMS